MRDNFEKSLELVLKHEGGFTSDERDNGNKLPDGRKGSTMLGVTQANWEAYVGHHVTWDDMKALKPSDVAPLYRKNYWGNIGDELPKGVDYLYFDFGVNAGPSRAAKVLQSALGVVADGVIGPKTLAAIKEADPIKLIDKFSESKEAFYRSLKLFSIYGNGWLRRVKESSETAKAML